jgi:hypothetical protein
MVRLFPVATRPSASDENAEEHTHTERDAHRLIRMLMHRLVHRLGFFDRLVANTTVKLLAVFQRGGETLARFADFFPGDIRRGGHQCTRVFGERAHVIYLCLLIHIFSLLRSRDGRVLSDPPNGFFLFESVKVETERSMGYGVLTPLDIVRWSSGERKGCAMNATEIYSCLRDLQVIATTPHISEEQITELLKMKRTDKAGRFFTGSPTDKAIWMLIAGIAATVIGLFGTMRGANARTASLQTPARRRVMFSSMRLSSDSSRLLSVFHCDFLACRFCNRVASVFARISAFVIPLVFPV